MSQLLYYYGPAAWFWRALMLLFAGLAAVFLVAGVLALEPLALLGAAALFGPVVFFGTVVVVRAHRLDDGSLDIETLLFVHRRITSSRIGVPRVRVNYENLPSNLRAPRVWVPVKGALPIYFDLLGNIPDRQAFLAAVNLRADEVSRAR